VTLKALLLIIIVVLLGGSVAAYALVAGSISKLLRRSRWPGLIAYNRTGRARWSGTIPLDELSTTGPHPDPAKSHEDT
jgi:hypothetical protein